MIKRLPRLRSRLLAPALSGSGSEPGARAGAGNFGVGSGSRAQSRSQASQRSQNHAQSSTKTTPDLAGAPRWYFGGLAGILSVASTHPLDLAKVHQQTHFHNLPLHKVFQRVYRSDGLRGLFNGLSAALLRQLTYSTVRFGVYHEIRRQLSGRKCELRFKEKVVLDGVSGAIGGAVGQFADIVNVRLQHDVKLHLYDRRRYSHVFDGISRISREEGGRVLFNGMSMNIARGALMTIGQLSVYDKIKPFVMSKCNFSDNFSAHVILSSLAATVATILTQPLDVVKTKMMNKRPGEFHALWHCVVHTAMGGVQGFYKGFFPALTRLIPHTVLLMVTYEQLRLRFGYLPAE
uniref:Mitochondrial dicarboxylate carrier n=1 Tax=Bursaphelenchus xylophilus TaxID=6326 RepID=A0A1I7SUT3_BURXY